MWGSPKRHPASRRRPQQPPVAGQQEQQRPQQRRREETRGSAHNRDREVLEIAEVMAIQLKEMLQTYGPGHSLVKELYENCRAEQQRCVTLATEAANGNDMIRYEEVTAVIDLLAESISICDALGEGAADTQVPMPGRNAAADGWGEDSEAAKGKRDIAAPLAGGRDSAAAEAERLPRDAGGRRKWEGQKESRRKPQQRSTALRRGEGEGESRRRRGKRQERKAYEMATEQQTPVSTGERSSSGSRRRSSRRRSSGGSTSRDRSSASERRTQQQLSKQSIYAQSSSTTHHSADEGPIFSDLPAVEELRWTAQWPSFFPLHAAGATGAFDRSSSPQEQRDSSNTRSADLRAAGRSDRGVEGAQAAIRKRRSRRGEMRKGRAARSRSGSIQEGTPPEAADDLRSTAAAAAAEWLAQSWPAAAAGRKEGRAPTQWREPPGGDFFQQAAEAESFWGAVAGGPAAGTVNAAARQESKGELMSPAASSREELGEEDAQLSKLLQETEAGTLREERRKQSGRQRHPQRRSSSSSTDYEERISGERGPRTPEEDGGEQPQPNSRRRRRPAAVRSTHSTEELEPRRHDQQQQQQQDEQFASADATRQAAAAEQAPVVLQVYVHRALFLPVTTSDWYQVEACLQQQQADVWGGPTAAGVWRTVSPVVRTVAASCSSSAECLWQQRLLLPLSQLLGINRRSRRLENRVLQLLSTLRLFIQIRDSADAGPAAVSGWLPLHRKLQGFAIPQEISVNLTPARSGGSSSCSTISLTLLLLRGPSTAAPHTHATAAVEKQQQQQIAASLEDRAAPFLDSTADGPALMGESAATRFWTPANAAAVSAESAAAGAVSFGSQDRAAMQQPLQQQVQHQQLDQLQQLQQQQLQQQRGDYAGMTQGLLLGSGGLFCLSPQEQQLQLLQQQQVQQQLLQQQQILSEQLQQSMAQGQQRERLLQQQLEEAHKQRETLQQELAAAKARQQRQTKAAEAEQAAADAALAAVRKKLRDSRRDLENELHALQLGKEQLRHRLTKQLQRQQMKVEQQQQQLRDKELLLRDARGRLLIQRRRFQRLYTDLRDADTCVDALKQQLSLVEAEQREQQQVATAFSFQPCSIDEEMPLFASARPWTAAGVSLHRPLARSSKQLQKPFSRRSTALASATATNKHVPGVFCKDGFYKYPIMPLTAAQELARDAAIAEQINVPPSLTFHRTKKQELFVPAAASAPPPAVWGDAAATGSIRSDEHSADDWQQGSAQEQRLSRGVADRAAEEMMQQRELELLFKQQQLLHHRHLLLGEQSWAQRHQQLLGRDSSIEDMRPTDVEEWRRTPPFCATIQNQLLQVQQGLSFQAAPGVPLELLPLLQQPSTSSLLQQQRMAVSFQQVLVQQQAQEFKQKEFVLYRSDAIQVLWSCAFVPSARKSRRAAEARGRTKGTAAAPLSSPPLPHAGAVGARRQQLLARAAAAAAHLAARALAAAEKTGSHCSPAETLAAAADACCWSATEATRVLPYQVKRNSNNATAAAAAAATSDGPAVETAAAALARASPVAGCLFCVRIFSASHLPLQETSLTLETAALGEGCFLGVSGPAEESSSSRSQRQAQWRQGDGTAGTNRRAAVTLCGCALVAAPYAGVPTLRVSYYLPDAIRREVLLRLPLPAAVFCRPKYLRRRAFLSAWSSLETSSSSFVCERMKPIFYKASGAASLYAALLHACTLSGASFASLPALDPRSSSVVAAGAFSQRCWCTTGNLRKGGSDDKSCSSARSSARPKSSTNITEAKTPPDSEQYAPPERCFSFSSPTPLPAAEVPGDSVKKRGKWQRRQQQELRENGRHHMPVQQQRDECAGCSSGSGMSPGDSGAPSTAAAAPPLCLLRVEVLTFAAGLTANILSFLGDNAALAGATAGPAAAATALRSLNQSASSVTCCRVEVRCSNTALRQSVCETLGELLVDSEYLVTRLCLPSMSDNSIRNKKSLEHRSAFSDARMQQRMPGPQLPPPRVLHY